MKTLKRFPFVHLSLAEVAERERLVSAYWAGQLSRPSADYNRMTELCRRTPSGCANYLTCRHKEPEDCA